MTTNRLAKPAAGYQSEMTALDWYHLAVQRGRPDAAAAWMEEARRRGEIVDGKARAAGA